MSWPQSVLSVVAKLAPTIASAIGGPLAGSAVTAIEGVFGLKPGTSIAEREDATATAIAGATPEDLLKLKQADNDFQVKMAELGFKDAEALAALATQDRDSARKREVDVKDWTPRILAGAVTVGFFGMLTFVLLHQVPAGSTQVVDILLGSLGTAWTGIISYYFGSSSDASHKNDLLANSTPQVSK